MIYTAPKVKPVSSPFRAQLRTLYTETNDQAALRELDAIERREAFRACSVVCAAWKYAPRIAVALAVALAGIDISNLDVGGWHEQAWSLPPLFAAARPLIRFLG